MIDALYNGGLNLLAASWWTTMAWPVLWILIKIVAVLAPLMGAVAYLTLAIPLFGIGIGGADIPQQVVGGAIGGAFWSIPFALTSRSTG